jgi:hypothetical protein
MMGDDEVLQLAEDIAAHGQREAIVTFEGLILDGRSRAKACELAGVAPRFREHDGSDAFAFVVSANLHRRHLTADERKAIARRLIEGNPSQTDTSIAGQAKLHYHTVRKVRRELAVELPHVATAPRFARDGRHVTGRPPGPNPIRRENRWLEAVGRHLAKEPSAVELIMQVVIQHAELIRAGVTPERRRKLLSSLGTVLLGDRDIAA